MRKGPLLNLVATFAFATMTALVKHARGELDPFAVMFWRCLVAIPLAIPFMGIAWRVRSPRAIVVRVLLGFGAMTALFTAAKDLPLAELSLISRLQPILVAILAPIVLGAGERVHRAVWLALPVGLLGSAVLIAPDFHTAAWSAGAIAFVGCIFSAGAHVTVRGLGPTEDPRAVVFWFHAGGALLALPLSLAFSGPASLVPSPSMVPFLVAIGATALVGQTLMTHAYTFDRAALVVAVSYSEPLFAAVFDTLFFQGPPPWRVIVGGGLVLATSAFVIYDRGEKPKAPAL